jgi:hypothetical protein
MPSNLGPKFLSLVFVCGAATFATQLQAQAVGVVSPIDDATPLHLALAPDVEPDLTDCGPGMVPNPIVLDLHYTGEHALRAYTVALYFPDLRDAQQTRKVVASKIMFPPQPYIEPGTNWQMTFCRVPAGVDPATIHPQVDMVSYDDGTTAGPLEISASFRLLGMADGASLARGDRSTPSSEPPERVEADAVAAKNSESVTQGGLQFTPVIDAKRNVVVIQATNVGKKPVRAYFYKVEFYDSASGRQIRQIKTQIVDPRSAEDAVLAPGETWAAGLRRLDAEPNGAAVTVKVTSPFIVYADRTTFGPLTAPTSQELLGIVEGLTQGPIATASNGGK